MIKLIRNWTPEQNYVVVQIYEKNYCYSLFHINKLVGELRKDFPNVLDSDINIHKYGGDRLKRIMFIEEIVSSVPINIPEGYIEISTLEYIL